MYTFYTNVGVKFASCCIYIDIDEGGTRKRIAGVFNILYMCVRYEEMEF